MHGSGKGRSDNGLAVIEGYFVVLQILINMKFPAGLSLNIPATWPERTVVFLIFLLSFLPAHLPAQRKSIRFQHITSDEGLSQNMIDCILKDHNGFMWFGTWDGLNRFNGYSFDVYRHDPSDPHSISSNFVYTMDVDTSGNIWIGTRNGLNVFHYAGNRFYRYLPENGEANSICSNIVQAVLCDRNGNIWVGTDKGLEKLILRENGYEIREVVHVSRNPAFSSSGTINITSLYEDGQGRVWIGTGDGLFVYCEDRDDFMYFGNDPEDSNTLSNNVIHCVYQDRAGIYWVGTQTGLNRFDAETRTWKGYSHQQDDPSSLVHNYVMSVTEDLLGNLIVGTLGGLSIYREEIDGFTNYRHRLNIDWGLNNDFINCLYADESGNVWVGTERGGVNRYNVFQERIGFFVNEPDDPNSLNYNTVNSIYEDESYIWIGTAGGGLNRYNKKTGTFRFYRGEQDKPGALGSDFITSMIRDREGNLWIGTWGDGLFELTPGNVSSGRFIRYGDAEEGSGQLISDFISSLVTDDRGNLWIGTLGGLDRFDLETHTFTHVGSDSLSVVIDQVGCLEFDAEGNLWVGTRIGLHRISPEEDGVLRGGQNSITTFVHDSDDPFSLSGNYVISIHRGGDGTMWFGTYGNGLDKMIQHTAHDTPRFIHFTTEDGLSNNIVYGILEDDNGCLWLSTDHGLSRFDPENERFFNLFVSDGLTSNQFYWMAAYRNAGGRMYFGSMNGCIAFYPDSVSFFSKPPRVVLTDFKIFNRPVEVGVEYGNRVVLQKNITLTDRVLLSYRQKEFSFEFSALEYSQPQKVEYAYLMQGFDEEWKYVDHSHRLVSYTNLRGGEYFFLVKAGVNGQWTEPPLKIKITVIPPFWVQWWFRILVAVVVIMGIMLYIRWRTFSLERQKKILEELVKRRTAKIEEHEKTLLKKTEQLRNAYLQTQLRQEKIEEQKEELVSRNIEILQQRNKLVDLNKRIQEINQQQLRFFTQISHEFKTPLTLIITPLTHIINQLEAHHPLRARLMLIQRNARRLLHLINQLMEIRKIKTGHTDFRPERGDLPAFVESLSQSFSELARQKKITFVMDNAVGSCRTTYDRDKMEIIISNLLSNAFKNTPENGKITVSVSITGPRVMEEEIQILGKRMIRQGDTEEFLEIRVQDTGIGIESQNLKDIFRNFYRISGRQEGSPGGTGIGLFLTKELVKIHRGLLYVKSAPGRGTTFRVLIPRGNEALVYGEYIRKQDDLLVEKHGDAWYHHFVPKKETVQSDRAVQKEEAGASDEKHKPLLLFLDDDEDMVGCMIDFFTPSYRMLTAGNATDGMALAEKFSPDIIISDIMMPGIDGIEFASRIKSNLLTSHIPVILLSARSEVEDFVEGLESGADDYISKPFHLEILEAKITSLLSNRRKLQKIFSGSLIPAPGDIATSATDREFIGKILNIVEGNLTDPEFGVQRLASEMCVSRSLLHKKLSAIAGMSANDFITTLRLKKAARLLLQGRLNITGVAFEVGFNDPKYFSRCFKKYFGKSPTDYIHDSGRNPLPETDASFPSFRTRNRGSKEP